MRTAVTGQQEGDYSIRSIDASSYCFVIQSLMPRYDKMRNLVCKMIMHQSHFNQLIDSEWFSEFLLLHRHIIGKDIIWFHCVIWPCILMSAGVTLPVGVFSHGFVNAADGRKMSKSYNNAIDPHEVGIMQQEERMNNFTLLIAVLCSS